MEALSVKHPCPGSDPLIQVADFQNTQGIIFVVDSNDRERITEAREECEWKEKQIGAEPKHA